MIKIENLVTPSAEWWNVAIKGMRNSYKSAESSDSRLCLPLPFDRYYDNCEFCEFYKDEPMDCDYPVEEGPVFALGLEDKKLLLDLCGCGTSHRKVLRQLPVIMDITAPLYWWKQMDQYKLGTVTNSESTMHTMLKKPFKLSDFSLFPLEFNYDNMGLIRIYSDLDEVDSLINHLNVLRNWYFKISDTSTRKGIWNHINQLLPQSYNQKRTWSASYETLVNIIHQRKGHTLKEWDAFIDYLLEHVPYLKEIVEAVDG